MQKTAQCSKLPKVAIYVASFDGYSDLWPPFFHLFWKFWPDCPYDVFLGTNSRSFSDKRVTVLHAPDTTSWSDRLHVHLNQLDHDYVIMMLDDWFLHAPVMNADMERLVSIADVVRAHCIRLVPDPKPSRALGGIPEIGFMNVGVQNRTSTHATIWRRTSLLELVRPGESLWEFEVYGAARSNIWAGAVFSVWTAPINYFGAVDAGKFTRSAARYLANEKIVYNQDASRKIKTLREQLKHTFRNRMFDVLRLFLSHRARQRLRLLLYGQDAYSIRK